MKTTVKRVDIDGTIRVVNVYIPTIEDDRVESLRELNPKS